MLNENIKNLRKANNLSQDELADKLNVVRQTVSKWEKGLSVPDAEMLIKIAEVFKVSVSQLLGETINTCEKEETIKEISEKLEKTNEELISLKEKRRKTKKIILIVIAVISILLFIFYGAVLISYFHSLNIESQALGVIGGADGPTAIFITYDGFPQINITAKLIISLVAAVLSIAGLVKLKKRH